MMDYASITHCTANEDGKEELVLEIYLPLWKQLYNAVAHDNPATTVKEYYVVDGLRWVEKFTGKTPDSDKQHELFECKGWIKRQARMDEFFGAHK